MLLGLTKKIDLEVVAGLITKLEKRCAVMKDQTLPTQSALFSWLGLHPPEGMLPQVGSAGRPDELQVREGVIVVIDEIPRCGKLGDERCQVPK